MITKNARGRGLLIRWLPFLLTSPTFRLIDSHGFDSLSSAPFLQQATCRAASSSIGVLLLTKKERPIDIPTQRVTSDESYDQYWLRWSIHSSNPINQSLVAPPFQTF